MTCTTWSAPNRYPAPPYILYHGLSLYMHTIVYLMCHVALSASDHRLLGLPGAHLQQRHRARHHEPARPLQSTRSRSSLYPISYILCLFYLLSAVQAAGIVPTSLALCFVCGASSLCGTFLAQTIAAIPGIPCVLCVLCTPTPYPISYSSIYMCLIWNILSVGR